MKKTIIALLILLCCFSVFGNIMNGPEWVWNEECEEFDPEYFYAVGSGKYKTVSNSLKAAKVQAKAGIARSIGETINALTDEFQEEAGAEGNTQLLKILRDYASSIVKNQKVSEVKQIDVWQDSEDGTVYVLMRAPKSIAKKEVENVVDQAFKKDRGAKEAEKKVNELVDKFFSE